MPVKFQDPLVQSLTERLLTKEEREYLTINGKTAYSAVMPQDETYAELLRQQVPELKKMAERIETLLLIYDFAKKAGLSLDFAKTTGLSLKETEG